MTFDQLLRVRSVLSAQGSIEILILLSHGPCTKTEVYRELSGHRHISDTLDVLSYHGLIVIDDGDDPASISLTYRGHMIVDLLRWMEMILRPIVF